jgi:hypothetical protein
LDCYFHDAIDLRKGEIVKLSQVIPNSNPLIASVVENITTETIRKSRMGDVTTEEESPPYPPTEIIGKVQSSVIRSSGTDFTLIQGSIQEHVFYRAGETKNGRDAIVEILSNQLQTYVKIWDPYISEDSIRLLSHVRKPVDILILTQKITNLSQIKSEVSKLGNKVIIRRCAGLNDRFVLTGGEGLSIGNSLKDFETKANLLSKLIAPLEVESPFDDTWNLSKDIA